MLENNDALVALEHIRLSQQTRVPLKKPLAKAFLSSRVALNHATAS
jgi:hypothetical protein